MTKARPFRSDAALFEAAQRVWWALTPTDWLEAFAQHPRIGERATEESRHVETARWARREQSGVAAASPATRQLLADRNRTYEQRFGHVFLISATGLTADDILRQLKRRLANDPARELKIAAAEQAKITRLRLEKLVTP